MNQSLLKTLIEADLTLTRAWLEALAANRRDIADEINEARLHLTEATSLVVAGKESR